jgi:exonuclease SbcC
MRPIRLDLAGFTVFRDETTLDFTDADFFALVGPTGAGKSTILDAICFALYGTVPRWGGTRGIGNALAPSATEARVRLVFESARARYVATRVVRRDGRGNVKTAAAGLQLMPEGFDVTRLDTGMSLDDLGEVLAGTPAEMETAVQEAVGLPYEQFTSCVVLPQGQFADFLHAKPAVRQQILVNLLGLHVYEAVQKNAAGRATEADAHVAAADQVLAGLADADDEAVEAAAQRAERLRSLTVAVETAVPRLRAAEQGADAARQALAAIDAELAVLTGVRAPAEVADVAGAVVATRVAAADAADAVHAAEEREEKLRGEVAAAGETASLRLLLGRHAEHRALTEQVAWLAGAVGVAEVEHTAAAAAVELARAEEAAAAAELERARAAYTEAGAVDRAAALRAHLTPGDACPVCEQTVGTVPPVPAGSAVAAAKAAGEAARAAHEKAAKVLKQRDAVARETERGLDRKRAQHDQEAARLAEIGQALASSPGEAALQRQLADVSALQERLDAAGAAVRTAREAQRRAQAGADSAEAELRRAWQAFDTARDRVGRLGPPPADRDDVAAAWRTLVGWADVERRARQAGRADAQRAVADAQAATAAARDGILVLFADAGVTAPGGADADLVRAAAIAAERADAQRQRLVERRAEAHRLREQKAGHERAGQVARTLAGHLRANNFERWLLEEALDLLVDGASRILRELTAGQYDLVHDKGEFFVVDHHDAGLRRGVRTLSGGETFQASLALALALSEQLAGMSTTAASLESIVLDEGFGTLDAATLDTVAATLETLAARGDRMVGVVTHVPALADRVPVRFLVTKDARSARVERTGL